MPPKTPPIQKTQRNTSGLALVRRPGTKSDMIFGTWNVRTLYRGGALRKLTDVFMEYKLDVLAVQEMRWTGKGVMDKRNCSVYYSCHERLHHFGTGFIVSKRIRDKVIEFKPVNERICRLRIRGKTHNISIICAHAPTEDKSDEDKDKFYDLLEKTYSECRSNDLKLIMGDFNAKIGHDINMSRFVGNESLHEVTSTNGLRLLDFAISTNMVIGSTTFIHKKIHKVTWRSPDGQTLNQIDHILIDLRHRSSLIDIRTFRGANVDSDHFLVASKLRHKINRSYHKKRNNDTKKIDTEYLKKTKIANEYRKELKSTIVVRDVAPTVETTWQDLKQTIINASKKTIPEIKKGKTNLWFDEECSEITKKKNEAYKTMIQKHYTRAAEERYKELRREEKRTHKKKKREYMEDLYRDIEHLKTQKEARKFYQLVNNVRADFNPRTTTCRKKNGDLTRDPDEVLVRWREHFVELLAGKDEVEDLTTHNMLPTINSDNEDLEHNTPTMHEIEIAMKKLNNNRSAGPDSIKAELFKTNEMSLNKAIHDLICSIWTQEQMPTEWEEASVCPIHKKGDKLDCGNYRGISLLNSAYKIFSIILFHRLETYTSKIIGNYQCGFQKGKTTTDQLHTIRQILEKTKEYNIDTYHLFIDYKSAYDSVNREKLLEAMLDFNIPKKLVSLTRMTLKRVSCRVKILSSLSEPFFTEKGLRQGDSLSCLLFNIALEKAIRDSGINTNGTILQRTIQLLAFADDIDIIGRTKSSVINAFVALESAAKEMGLVINADKTKFLISTNNSPDLSPLKIGNYTFETVKQFTYLGTLISSSNDLKIEINNRIFKANRCFYGLRNQFKSKFISVNTKLSIYKTLIRPIVLYGSECWTLNKTVEEKLLIFERKLLRKIFGPIQENNEWRILYNHEINRKYSKFGGTDIVRTIKASRIRWLGHLYRCADAFPTKKVTFSKIEGTRRRGRPPTQWLDDVERDLKLMGINRWRAVAANRANWRRISKSALACKMLLSL